jgi:serine/threonine protein kinase
MDKLQPGQTLGNYRIIGQVGRGGMATVYKAYQASMDRYVAVKILPSELAESAEFAGRFEQEARTIARLEHPRILPVFDYGKSDGISYLVMRYLEAGTLKDRLAAGPLSLEEIDVLFRQLADALGYAHGRGVVHRDLKPANALVDGEGNLFLTDFGIAKILAGTAQFTKTDAVMGTPAYISPEQAQGKPVDQRSDIYSLGIILYEMVTGQVPYIADTPLAVIFKHVSDPLPLPSSIKPDVPPAIEQVILKSLAKDPQDRFATAAEFSAAWKRALATTETTPAPLPQPPPDDATVAATASPTWKPDERTVLSEPPASQPRRRSAVPWLVGCALVACLVFTIGGIAAAATGWRSWAFLRPRPSQTPSVTAVSSVTGGNPSADTFTISIGDDISNGVPGPGAGLIEAPGSQDIYTLAIDPGKQVYFQIIDAPSSSNLIDLVLTDDFGNDLFNSCLQCGDPGTVPFDQGGTYTLTVGREEPEGAGTGAYRIKLWDVPPQDMFTLNLDDLVSDGVPGPGAGRVESPGASDRYTFSVDPGQIVYFEVREEPQTSDLLGWHLEDDVENKVFDTCLECGDPGRITLERGGQYSIVVGNQTGPATGTYEFIAWNVPPPDEFLIEIGATISKDSPGGGAGNIEVPGAQDIYTFNAGAGQQVQFLVRATPQSNDLLGWELQDELGNQVFDTCLQCGDPGTVTLERGGEYRLIVGSTNSPATGVYQVQVLPP